MIVLSRSLMLQTAPHVDLRAPVILWNSLVTAGNITASSEDEAFPASNLATDTTIEHWLAATATDEVVIEILPNGQEVDAIGIARHNFGSAQCVVSVEAQVSLPWVLATGAWDDSGFWRTDDVPEDPFGWIEIVEPRLLPDNSPVLFRFPVVEAQAIRLRIQPAGTPPSAAVLYAGKLLVMPHGITAGHVPLDQAHQTQVVNGKSEAGNFLGRIITGQSAQTSARFDLLPIDWYYETMEPFVDRGTSGPFFFAWLPHERPGDVGFAWLESDPRPNLGSIYFDITLDYGGITR